jgi:polygalacturonase
MNASFVHLTLPAAGSVNVNVKVLTANGTAPVGVAALRPRGSPSVTVSGPSTLAFSISAPGHYILEIDGEYNVETLSTGLMVFVSSPYDSPPSPTDSSVTYYGAGVHTIPGGVLTLRNDSTVYLAPGAVVLGRIEGAYLHNVSLIGQGILAAEWLPGDPLPPSASCGHCGCPGTNAVFISNSSDVTIDGITILHVTSWMVKLQGVSGARISSIKELGWRCNNDGIDIVSSEDVVIERCFIRSADDAIAIKGLDTTKETKNIVIRDSMFFPHGNCMEIGFELWNNAVRNVTFERNLCLHQMMNAFSIHNGGHAAVSEITYRDIVIEGINGSVSHDQSYGYKLVDLQISQGKYSGPDMARRGSISNVTYSNTTYRSNGLQWVLSRIVGNSTEHSVDEVRFDDFTLDGTAVMALEDMHTLNNSFVEHVSFSSI